MRKFTAGLAVATFALTLFASFVVPGLLGHPQWFESADIWTTAESARWIWNGAVGTVYQANPWWSALPGFPAVLAPFVAFGDHLGLAGGFPFSLAYPPMWLVLAPVCAGLGAWSLVGVQSLADRLDVPAARQKPVLGGVALLGVVPTVLFGHPEDLLALGAACLSLVAIRDDRYDKAAAWLCMAIVFQTWAGLLLPVAWAMAPAGSRRRFAVLAAGFPAALGLVLVGLDPAHALTDLAGQPMVAHGQHLVWWRMARHMRVVYEHQTIDVVAGSSSRSLAVLAAAGAGALQLRRPGYRLGVVLAAAALVGRAMFETEVWSYYLLPGAVLLALVAASSPSPRGYRVGAGAAAIFVMGPFMAYGGVGFPAWLWTAGALAVVAVGFAAAAAGGAGAGSPCPQGRRAARGRRPRRRSTGIAAGSLNPEPDLPIVTPAIGR